MGVVFLWNAKVSRESFSRKITIRGEKNCKPGRNGRKAGNFSKYRAASTDSR